MRWLHVNYNGNNKKKNYNLTVMLELLIIFSEKIIVAIKLFFIFLKNNI